MWTPIELPAAPIPRCGAEPGESCRSADCGTWDYDDAIEDEFGRPL